jgi:Uma2 family endonuclease
MTAEEFFEWLHDPQRPDNLWELHRGQVVREHAHQPGYYRAQGRIARLLGDHVSSRGESRVVGMGTGLIVGRQPDSVRKACIAVYATEEEFENLENGFAYRPPLLVVEMVEPGKSIGTVFLRISEFQRMGVPVVWLVDPEERAVTRYRRGENLVVLGKERDLSAELVLPGFRCRVGDLFSETVEPGDEPTIVQA